MGLYNMPLTLEKHFGNLTEAYPDVKELYSLWQLLRKKADSQLAYSQNVFVNYSFHDGSHSRAVLQMIERFLGDERISCLSATDTFMLLACSYVHDYGMAQTFNKVYDILESEKFSAFLQETKEKGRLLEAEDAWAVGNLLEVVKENRKALKLGEIYLSIMLALQMYLRPEHWKGVIDVEKDMHGLFEGNIKQRFVHGLEGIIEICRCHGQPVEALLALSARANGMVGDDYHPCFVAVMLRLGDLLDMDNERFPRWFVEEIAKGRNVIPRLSFLHYRKHEAINHLLVTPECIEITAECGLETAESEGEKEREQKEQEAYEVAGLLAEWEDWIRTECQQMAVHWNEIAPLNFGRPPGNVNIHISVNGRPYARQRKRLQMQMPQERVMDLLEGTSIYQNKFVGIREMLQNAVDASLLQLWSDVLQNRYVAYGLFGDKSSQELDLLDFAEKGREHIFRNYNITVEVILLEDEGKVIVVVKDKGIGIMPEDVEFISNIGSSKEKNERVNRLLQTMPKWLKPSGVFGIGLQSVFQLTDCIEFYTRQHNMPEQKIMLHSYGKNQGKVEIREVVPNENGTQFYDNAVPGTNVVIVVEPRKLFGEEGEKNHFIYYDPEFDKGDILDMLFAEMSQVCENAIKTLPYDYFNVYFQSFKTGKKYADQKKEQPKCLKRSYFCPELTREKRSGRKLAFGESLYSLASRKGAYSFTDNMAWYWDRESCRAYRLKVRPCAIIKERDDDFGCVLLPERVPNLYNIIYKFSPIRNAETIYSPDNQPRQLHAGFLELEVLILDDQPTTYLNIDRERLREGAIDEEKLLAVRRKILLQWCAYFSERGEREEEQGGRFKNMPGVLLSLALLFYQNVPQEDFLRFIAPYEGYLAAQNLCLEEEIPFTSLWEEDKLFQLRFLDLFVSVGQEDEPEEEATELFPETVQCLPHRLIHIRKIFCSGEVTLVYLFQLHMSENSMKPVELSQKARLYDYAMALDSYPVKSAKKKTNIEYLSLQKKLFKPDSCYEELLLPCYPKNFTKGRNFETSMDHCFTCYLLSPFDEETCRRLKVGLEDAECARERLVSEIKAATEGNRQLAKCVDYIFNKRYRETEKEEPLKKQLRQKYIQFIENYCTLLFDNRDWLKEQFSRDFD